MAMAGIDRAARVNMTGNHFFILNETEFSNFVSRNMNHMIDIGDNTLDCNNCGNYWLVRDRYAGHVDATCFNSTKLLDVKNFVNCSIGRPESAQIKQGNNNHGNSIKVVNHHTGNTVRDKENKH